MQTTPLDETFGLRLRETIERQEAEEREGAANGATTDQ
jgi:hypothetical protein